MTSKQKSSVFPVSGTLSIALLLCLSVCLAVEFSLQRAVSVQEMEGLIFTDALLWLSISSGGIPCRTTLDCARTCFQDHQCFFFTVTESQGLCVECRGHMWRPAVSVSRPGSRLYQLTDKCCIDNSTTTTITTITAITAITASASITASPSLSASTTTASPASPSLSASTTTASPASPSLSASTTTASPASPSASASTTTASPASPSASASTTTAAPASPSASTTPTAAPTTTASTTTTTAAPTTTTTAAIPAPWLELKTCSTNADCTSSAANSVCRYSDNKCVCNHNTYYSVSTRSCQATCSAANMQNTYSTYPGDLLYGADAPNYPQIAPVANCKSLCAAQSLCTGFNFCGDVQSSNWCAINIKASTDPGTAWSTDACTYYKRQCA